MAIYKVLTFPHVLLRKKAAPVQSIDANAKKFCADMIETMYAMEGIGLAAPQVGILKRIFVMDIQPYLTNVDMKDWHGSYTAKCDGKESQLSFPIALINPEFLKTEGEVIFPYDGCLSFPGVSKGGTKRFEKILVGAKNSDGQSLEIECTGILSICMQHEMDHLNGVLFVDHTGKKIDNGEIQKDIQDNENDKEFRKMMKKIKPLDAQKHAPKIS